MKRYARLYLLGLIALFFISTTGILVYKHYCSHGGEFYGFFMDVNHNCEPENLVDENDTCCNSETNGVDFKLTKECCTSNVDFYQIDIDYINNDLSVDFEKVYTPEFSFLITSVFPEFYKIFKANRAPPVLTTTKRLSLFQMYLI